MALIIAGRSCCAICGTLLEDSDRGYLATSGVFFPEEDPLYPFCDAPLHWGCYEDWPERRRFATRYVSSEVESLSDNQYWGLALLTDLVCVTARNKTRIEKYGLDDPAVARVWLFETGTWVEVPLSGWSAWLSDLSLTQQPLDRLEIVSLWTVLPTLLDRLPTSDTVLAAIDWDAKAELARAKEEEEARADRARHDAIAAHNAACRQFVTACGAEGLTCPHCRSNDIEFVDRGRFFFVCQACGRSFGHDL